MAVPARKVSKTRKNKRRTHYKLNTKEVLKCEKCGAIRRSHRVCTSCGTYNGKEEVKVENN